MTDAADARRRALELIARREHTRAELRRKLGTAGTAEAIVTLLNELERAGLVSDARFVEVFVAARRARCGDIKLRHELRKKGVAEDLIDGALRVMDADEPQRARAVWERKFGAPPASGAEYARHARFLQSRGFSPSVVREVLRKPSE